jgi:hypothetical protein
MKKTVLFKELVSTYGRHGWRLRRILLTPATRREIEDTERDLLEEAEVADSRADALWFSRPSQANREAWELRLLDAIPYALFETFEADETDEQRDDVRLEMEARMRDYVNGTG